jgi:hypothetical protein
MLIINNRFLSLYDYNYLDKGVNKESIRDKEINPFWNSYFLKLASEVRIETEK